MSLSKNSHRIVSAARAIDGRLAYGSCPARRRSCLVALVLTLVLMGCSPPSTDPHPERPDGVSVIEHWQALGRIEDSLERTAAMAQFVTTLGPGDLDALRALATGMYWRNRSVDHLILMNAWSRLDPEAAMRVAAISRGSTGMAARADGVREWASRDPYAAVAAQIAPQESAVQRALVRGWYESGEPGLPEYVISDPTSKYGQNIMQSYAEELGYYEGADGIAMWIDAVRSLPGVDPLAVIHAHRKGIVEMAVRDVETAIAYCDLHCDQPYAENSRPLLADRMIRLGHGDRALEWAEASVDANPQERGMATRTAFGSLLRKDEEAGWAWADSFFEQHRGESWIEPVVVFAIANRNRFNPELSLKWVDFIVDDETKEGVLIAIGRHWIRLDPEGGERWIETSPLDEEAREEARLPLIDPRSKKRRTLPTPGA